MAAPETLPQLFLHAAEKFGGNHPALRYKAKGAWREITYEELETRVRHTALGLRELGISSGDRVALLSTNRPEWAIADLACLTIGAADVPIYPTLTAPQIAYMLRDSQARAVFVEDRAQHDKVSEIRDQLPRLEYVIALSADPLPDALNFEEVARRGAAAEPRYPEYRSAALTIRPDELATLIYTSGTTGEPKGVMLTHGNLTSNVHAGLQRLSLGDKDSCLSFLPLSHSFERTAGYYTMLQAGATINYAEGFPSVPSNLKEVQPTVVVSVPRVYEKMFAAALERALAGGALKRRIFFWARRTGERWADLVLTKRPVPVGLRFKRRLADRLVLSQLRAAVGGRIRYFISGSAPLSPDIARFFFAAGLPVLEGYGLTETSPIVSVNPYEAPRLGTVGPPINGVELKFADDGEILLRGPNIMRGYLNKPDATRAALTEDGWFRTGDIGSLDVDGYLTITDRKKDIVVTAGGKNIAPQPIENRVKVSAFVHNAVLIADRRKFPLMLVVPEVEAVKIWAKERNLRHDDPHELLRSPDVVAKIEREVMGKLRDLANYQMPKKIILLEEDFSIARGELTPTLKAKRRVIEEHYKDLVDAAYEKGEGKS